MNIIEILPNLFKVEVPLPRNPLKAVNSYIIKADKPLVIDTGFDMDLCYTTLTSALNKVGIDFRHADYFITHLHADHIGLAGRLTDKVYMSEIDAKIFYSEKSNLKNWYEHLEYLWINGFPKDYSEKILDIHPGIKYSGNFSNVSFITVKDGEGLDYADYHLKAVLTPGHTPGHMCLYDEEKKVLFSGDHILFDITPNISYWKGHESLGEYLKSLDKIYALEVSLTLPGHRNYSKDVKKRILELKEHHKKRLNEIINALKDGPKNAWQIAKYISWDLKYNDWEQIALTQKWFIVDETIAHLHYLENKGIITGELENEIIIWHLTNLKYLNTYWNDIIY
ncbi:MAG: MBL fold metallo-hydrolase [Caldisphaera sp.]